MPLPVRKEGLPPPADLRNFLLSEPPLLGAPPLLTFVASFLDPATGIMGDSSSELRASLKRGRGLPPACVITN